MSGAINGEDRENGEKGRREGGCCEIFSGVISGLQGRLVDIWER